jgi:hypothetical protein
MIKDEGFGITAIDPEDDGKGGNPPTGDSDDGRQY